MNSANIYSGRDPEAQGDHYLRHIDRMTVEELHSKSAIAAELAHRDIEIGKLKALNTELAAVAAAFVSYDVKDHDDHVEMMLDYAAMLKAARAALAKHKGAI